MIEKVKAKKMNKFYTIYNALIGRSDIKPNSNGNYRCCCQNFNQKSNKRNKLILHIIKNHISYYNRNKILNMSINDFYTARLIDLVPDFYIIDGML